MLLHALMAFGRGSPGFSLPEPRVGIEVGHAVVEVVPHEELVGIAAFLHIALLQEARFELEGARGEAEGLVAGRLDVVAYQERPVGPPFREQLVVEIVVDDDVEPAHGHSAVGAGTKAQPDIGLLAEIGHARVDHNVRVGLFGNVNDGAAGVVVIRHLRSCAPRRVHLWAADGFHPRGLHHGVHGGGEEARSFAHLPRNSHIGRAGQLSEGAVGEHAPDATSSRHAENGFAAVAIHTLLHFLSDGRR